MTEGSTPRFSGSSGHRILEEDDIRGFDFVEDIKRIQEPYKAANKKFHPEPTIVDLGEGIKIGGGNFQVIAGPCSVESEEQIVRGAKAVKASGATLLRGRAFKPRTSPYASRGLRAEGIELLSSEERDGNAYRDRKYECFASSSF